MPAPASLSPRSSHSLYDAQERWTKEKEARAAESGAAEGDDTAGLRNQFNFSERASQTLNFGSRSIATITEPPASVEYAATANEWSIFDAYASRDSNRGTATPLPTRPPHPFPPPPLLLLLLLLQVR
mgnify:CR=1 FL=1